MRFAKFVLLLMIPTIASGQTRSYPPKLEGARVETYKKAPQGDLKVWVFDPPNLRPGDRRPAIVFFFGFIIRLGSRLPFLILAVALFGNELYGRYNYTITTIEICAAFATFGFKRSLFRFIHDDEYAGKYSIEQVMISALLSSAHVCACA